MALQTLKALWASGDKFPITTLTFNLTLGFKYNGQPWIKLTVNRGKVML